MPDLGGTASGQRDPFPLLEMRVADGQILLRVVLAAAEDERREERENDDATTEGSDHARSLRAPGADGASPEPVVYCSAMKTRSWLEDEVGIDEIRTLTAEFRESRGLFRDDVIDGSIYDIVVVDGDLHVDGDLRVVARQWMGLVVRGALTVDGLFVDSDHPATGVFVLGDMRAGSVVTSGVLGVRGSLTVTGPLLGFYNDYGATIGGDLVTPLLHPENHHFTIGGRLEAKAVVGRNAEHRVSGKVTKDDVKARFPKDLLAILVEDVVRGELVEEQELDDAKLKKRVLEGLPVLR